MKTWEMIKELTENPEKEFICKSKGIFAEQKAYFYIDEYGEESIKIVNNETGNAIKKHHTNREWEEVAEVKEPVDFMAAVESSKRVRVEHPYISQPYEKSELSRDYQYLGAILDILSAAWGEDEIRKIILEGDWYIQ